MDLTFNTWITILVFFVSALKAAWDLFFSKWIFDKCSSGKRAENLTEEVKRKRTRDSISGVLAFALIAGLTILAIGDNAMTKEISREEFSELDKRLKVVESYFKPPGSGPFDDLSKAVAQLEEKLNEMPTLVEIQEDIDNLKRIVAELKKKLADDSIGVQVQATDS